MLRLSYPVALAAIAIIALIPGAIAMAFFDGPAGLFGNPFSPRMLGIGSFGSLVVLMLYIWDGFRAGVESPLGYAIAQVKRNPLALLAPVALIFLTVFPSRVFVLLKDAIPTHVPFYLDPLLLEADKLLFLGTDPWRVTHGLFGTAGTIVIDKIYIAWFMLIPPLAVWICATRDRNFQFRGILTLFFIWIVLGTFAAMALSSCGPVFYEEYYRSAYYAPLMAELNRADAISPLAMLPIAEWLLEQRASGNLGSGISAMPSVHVAIAFFFFLLMREKVGRWWAVVPAGLFCFAIWIGSFHLAWHYAWDGIVSIAAVYAFWRLLKLVEIEPAPSPEAMPSSLSGQEA